MATDSKWMKGRKLSREERESLRSDFRRMGPKHLLRLTQKAANGTLPGIEKLDAPSRRWLDLTLEAEWLRAVEEKVTGISEGMYQASVGPSGGFKPTRRTE